MSDESEELKVLTQNQLAFISWPTRTPKDNASFIEEINECIKTRFNETTPHKYSNEIQKFANLRNVALSVLAENSIRDANSLKALKKYYCQLIAIQNRFKDCKAIFPWKDSFGRGAAEGGIEFEINNIMYDIAAIHNEFGSKLIKNTESTTLEACTNFQNALWWVTELRDNRTGLKPKEMGHDLLTFYHHVLQAQAQECILLKAIRGKIGMSSLASITAQIANDYDVATKLVLTPLYTDHLKDVISGTSAFPSWKATVDFKNKFYMSLSLFFSGLYNRDDDVKEIGLRISHLKSATQFVEQCRKLAPDTIDSKASRSALTCLESLVSKKLDKAIRYNDNVYHASIPSVSPQVRSKLLVTPIPFSMSTSSPDFKDLFSSLVTIETVQVNSIYSQKKDDLMREVNSQVSSHDEELAQMMSTLNIDKRSLELPNIETPDDLIEICAELSLNPNIVDDVLTKLELLDDKLEEIQILLDDVLRMTTERPTRMFEVELLQYRKTHEEALRNTQSLHKQLYPDLQREIQLMSTTDRPAELLPKSKNSLSSGDEEIKRKLEKLIDKIDEMKLQRSSLLSQLRNSLNEDDVLKHVVAASSESEFESVFDQEIQKHDKYKAPLQANLRKQKEILDELERVNAQYGQVRLNYRNQRLVNEERVKFLKKYYEQFKIIIEGIDEGLTYQNKMIEVVKRFHQKVKDRHDGLHLMD